MPYAGSFFDGFGNRMTMVAYANPDPGVKAYAHQVSEEHPRSGADGFGVVRFDTDRRTITMECWPRLTDVTAPGASQYAGWPITIRQEDNYGRAPAAWLPAMTIRGAVAPVVTVTDAASGEAVYAIRIHGNTFQPKVFAAGLYTVTIDEAPGKRKVLEGLRAGTQEEAGRVVVDL